MAKEISAEARRDNRVWLADRKAEALTKAANVHPSHLYVCDGSVPGGEGGYWVTVRMWVGGDGPAPTDTGWSLKESTQASHEDPTRLDWPAVDDVALSFGDRS